MKTICFFIYCLDKCGQFSGASSFNAPTLREIQRLSPAEIELWYEAMDIELQALRDKDTMIEINRSDVPHGKQIVKSTWAFKRK